MGTNRVKEEFENDYQTDPKWKILFNTDADDQRRLVNRPYLNINANVNPRAAVEGRQQIPRLPYPFPRLTFEEKSDFVTRCIYIDYLQRGAGNKKKIVFGDPLFRASWWDNDTWDWTQTTHFRKNPNYPGPGSLSDFLNDQIRRIMAHANLDLAQHHDPNYDRAKFNRRRGIAPAPAVVQLNDVAPLQQPDDLPDVPAPGHVPGPALALDVPAPAADQPGAPALDVAAPAADQPAAPAPDVPDPAADQPADPAPVVPGPEVDPLADPAAAQQQELAGPPGPGPASQQRPRVAVQVPRNSPVISPLPGPSQRRQLTTIAENAASPSSNSSSGSGHFRSTPEGPRSTRDNQLNSRRALFDNSSDGEEPVPLETNSSNQVGFARRRRTRDEVNLDRVRNSSPPLTRRASRRRNNFLGD